MTRPRGRGILSLFLLLAMTLASACSGRSQSQPAQAPANQGSQPATTGTEKRLSGIIKIGTSLALSGPYETGTKGHRSAVLMAVEDVNKSGLLDDAKLEVVQEDGMHTQEAAINAYQKLIQTHKVLAIFGPAAVPQALAAIPLAQQAKVLAFSPNPHPDVAKIGDHTFIAVTMYTDLVPELLKTVVKKYGIKRYGIVTQRDYPLAMINAEVRRKTLKELGVEVVLDETFLGTEADFSPMVTKILHTNPDAVVVDGTPPAEPLLDKQLRQAGYKGVMMAATSAITPTSIKASAEAFEGIINATGWLPNMPGASERSKDVTQRFRERFGFDLDMYSVGLYDNVWVLAHAIKKVGTTTDTEAIRRALMEIEVEGVQGKLKFNANRTQDHTLALFQVKNGLAVPISN